MIPALLAIFALAFGLSLIFGEKPIGWAPALAGLAYLLTHS